MDLNKLVEFLVVAQERSFTRAAARLAQDKAQLSRAIKSLEESLRVTLFTRSTRVVALTAEGEALFRRAGPLIAELEEVLGALPERAAVPMGEVKITTTPELGRSLLAPALVSFRLRYPGVRVAAILTHEVVEITRAKVDLALRVGSPGKSKSSVALRLGELRAGFFAAPSYIERRGAPQRLEELSQHERLWPAPQRGRRAFAAAGASPASIECDDFGMLAEMARLGGGVALLPLLFASREVSSGVLSRVLSGVSFGGAPIYLLSPPVRSLPRRASILREHLISFIRANT